MPVIVYPVAILSLIGIGVSLAVIANMLFYRLLGEVNGKRSPKEQISMVAVNLKLGRVLRIHTELFPESKKRQQMKRLFLTGFLLMAGGFIIGIVHYVCW